MSTDIPKQSSDLDPATYKRLFAEEVAKTGSARWWRHPAFYAGVAVLIVVGIGVLTDLPVPASHSDTVASVTSFVKEVETDAAPCSYAMGEAWQIYQADINGTATASDRAQMPNLLQQDLEACSYVQDYVVDLAGIAAPPASGGIDLRGLSTATLAWVDPDALGAITDIENYILQPSNRKPLADLTHREVALAADHVRAEGQLAKVDAALHTKLPALQLWAMPSK